MQVKFITTPDETGKGRVIVDGRHYGLPLAVVLEYQWLRDEAERPAEVSQEALYAVFELKDQDMEQITIWLPSVQANLYLDRWRARDPNGQYLVLDQQAASAK